MGDEHPQSWPNHETDIPKPKTGPRGHKAGIAMVVAWLAIMLLAWLAVGPCAGCATLATEAIKIAPEVSAELTAMKMTLAELEIRVGQINIGGSGDSITSWILACTTGGAAIFYPLGWRPIRRAFERRRNGNRDPPP